MIHNAIVYRRLQEKYSGVLDSSLHRFIRTIWQDQSDYKVLMARRMFNMNEALMRLWGNDEEDTYPPDTIMSNTAFLLCGRTIADQYTYRKRFPRILICDDIMLHGRGVMKLLWQFLEIVRERLEEAGAAVPYEQLKRDLSRSLIVYVYARNKEQILVEDYRILAVKELTAGELRKLSLQISGFLHDCDVANTSYVLSASPARYQLPRLLGRRQFPEENAFAYQGRLQNVYCRLKSPRILETMRFQFLSDHAEEGGILTSLVMFGDIKEEKFDWLCAQVADYFNKGVRYSQVASYLRLKTELFTRPKAQLLSFIYSLLSLTEFCREIMSCEGRELYATVVGGDFDKIVRNFDIGDIFRSEMLVLCRDVCTAQAAARPLWRLLDMAAQDAFDDGSFSDSREFWQLLCPTPAKSKSIYDYAEDIFYEAGIDSEYDAFQIIRTGRPYDARQDTYDTISLESYLSRMGKNRFNQAESIGGILGLMDSGLLAMNLDRQTTIDGDECRTVLKAGELATYVLPRRFNLFMPALAKVEREYRLKGKYIRDVVGGFIDYLQTRGYRQGKKVGQSDKRLLTALKKKKPLLLYIYSVGQSFQDWDIDLRTEPGSGAGRSYSFSDQEEQARRAYYLQCAKEYLAEDR